MTARLKNSPNSQTDKQSNFMSSCRSKKSFLPDNTISVFRSAGLVTLPAPSCDSALKYHIHPLYRYIDKVCKIHPKDLHLSPHFGMWMLPSVSSPSSASFLDPVRWHLNCKLIHEPTSCQYSPQYCVNILAETDNLLTIWLANWHHFEIKIVKTPFRF